MPEPEPINSQKISIGGRSFQIEEGLKGGTVSAVFRASTELASGEPIQCVVKRIETVFGGKERRETALQNEAQALEILNEVEMPGWKDLDFEARVQKAQETKFIRSIIANYGIYEENGEIYLIQEYAPEKIAQFDELSKLPMGIDRELLVLEIYEKIFQGVNLVHNQSLTLSDLKPPNKWDRLRADREQGQLNVKIIDWNITGGVGDKPLHDKKSDLNYLVWYMLQSCGISENNLAFTTDAKDMLKFVLEKPWNNPNLTIGTKTLLNKIYSGELTAKNAYQYMQMYRQLLQEIQDTGNFTSWQKEYETFTGATDKNPTAYLAICTIIPQLVADLKLNLPLDQKYFAEQKKASILNTRRSVFSLTSAYILMGNYSVVSEQLSVIAEFTQDQAIKESVDRLKLMIQIATKLRSTYKIELSTDPKAEKFFKQLCQDIMFTENDLEELRNSWKEFKNSIPDTILTDSSILDIDQKLNPAIPIEIAPPPKTAETPLEASAETADTKAGKKLLEAIITSFYNGGWIKPEYKEILMQIKDQPIKGKIKEILEKVEQNSLVSRKKDIIYDSIIKNLLSKAESSDEKYTIADDYLPNANYYTMKQRVKLLDIIVSLKKEGKFDLKNEFNNISIQKNLDLANGGYAGFLDYFKDEELPYKIIESLLYEE